MPYLILLIIYTLGSIFLTNFFLYLFNISNFLIIKDIAISVNMFVNGLIITIYMFLVLVLIILVTKKISLIKLFPVKLFIMALINSIIVLFCLINILQIEKIKEINNALSIVLTTFFATYILFYSIYYHYLLEYKRNH